MKATLTALAALLVATVPLGAVRAQAPYGYPTMPPGYGPGPGYVASNYSPGPVASAPAPGCDSCGKPGWFSKSKSCGCETCGKDACKKKGCDSCGKDSCGCEGWLKKCLCKKCPSNAPVLYKAEYPLGFPNHPYVRSPRDYFMWNDP
jgi:hypothetical protein